MASNTGWVSESEAILDGDDRLLGEVAYQPDLLVGERPNLLAVDGDRADQLVLLQHRYIDHRSSTGEVGEPHQRPLAVAVSLLGPDIRNVYELLGRKQAGERTVRAGTDHGVAPR